MYQENTYLFNAIYLEESQNLSYIRTENFDFCKLETTGAMVNAYKPF